MADRGAPPPVAPPGREATPDASGDGAASELLGTEPDAAPRGPGAPETTGSRHPHARAVVTVLTAIIVLLGIGVAASAFYIGRTVQAGIDWIDDPFADLTARPDPAGAPADDAVGPDDAGPSSAATPAPAPAPTAQPVTILVVGSDSRISAGDPSAWEYGAQRTDAIMVVQFAADRESAYVMSIPRDSWVDVPGYGMNKINAGFSYGGPPLMIQTVEQLMGVRMDHFIVADFESFAELTDLLGGVDITLAEPMSSRGLELAAGTHHLTGDDALIYVRQRYGLPRGDLDRVQRQQSWIRSIAATAEKERVLTDLPRLFSMLEVISGSLAVDEGFDLAAMAELAISLRDLGTHDVRYFTAPVAGLGRSPDGAQSIVVLDDARMHDVAAAFADATVGDYIAANRDDVDMLGDAVR